MQSIFTRYQSINLYRAIVQRRVLQCDYAETNRTVLRRLLNVLTDGAVRQFRGREFQSLGAATENDEHQCRVSLNQSIQFTLQGV